MPIDTYAKWLAKKNLIIKNSSVIQDVIDNFDLLNTEDKSFLKEELDTYSKALMTLKNVQSRKADVEKALKTMSGFKAFLEKENHGICNLERLQTDQILLEGNLYKLGDSAKVNNAIKTISETFELGFDPVTIGQNWLEKAGKENIVEKPTFREFTTVQIKDVNALLAEKAKGKNFLEFGCVEYKTVLNFRKAIDAYLTKLDDKFEKNPYKKDPKEVELYDNLQKFSKSIKTLQEGTTLVPLPEDDINESLANLAEMNDFFTRYDLEGKTNYMYLKEKMEEFNLTLPASKTVFGYIDKTLKVGLEPEKIVNSKPRNVVTRKAADWINDYKEYLQKNLTTAKKDPEYPGKYFGTIMAARMLSNSVRGDGSTLEKKFNTMVLEQKKNELLENEHYKAFLQSLKDNPKLMAKAESAAKTGHGGGLDDMFKEYLLKLPAGELHNDMLIGRFMPTAVDRIDELKKQAAAKLKANEPVVKEIAEILVIRDISESIRGEKSSLKKQIPTNKNLAGRVEKLSKETFLIEQAKKENVVSKIKEGHGGQLTEEIELAYNVAVDKNVSKEFVGTLKANKYGNRFNNNLADAEKLSKQIQEENAKKHPNKVKLDQLCNNAKGLIAEQIVLFKVYKDDDATVTDKIPWKKVDKAKQVLLSDESFQKGLFPNNTPEAHIKELTELSKAVTTQKYVEKAADKINKAEKKLANNVNRQKKPENKVFGA